MKKKILQLLRKEGVLTTQVVAQFLQKPNISAFRLLDSMVKTGEIVRLGKGRGAYYTQQKGLMLSSLDQKKEVLDSFRPFPAEIVKNISNTLEKKFIHSTNGVEGSKVTLRETDMILSGLSVRNSQDEINDVKLQKKAIEYISAHAKGETVFTELFIKEIQKIITSNVVDIFLNGQYRDHDVGIAGTKTVFPPANEVSSRMQMLLKTLESMEKKGYSGAKIAAYAHYHITAIHPFFDGNGRTARLFMNTLLLRYHYPVSFIALSDRDLYYQMLQQADAGNYSVFESYIFFTISHSLDIYLSILE